MIVFLDTEFTGFTETAELISVGMATDHPTAKTFYREVSNFHRHEASDFVKKEVLPLLEHGACSLPLPKVALATWEWLRDLHREGREEIFIAVDYYGDWVWLEKLLALAAAYGAPTKFPKGLHQRPVDIWPLIRRPEVLELTEAWYASQNYRRHHALHDALANREAALVIAPATPEATDIAD